jgi:hypothetical protein
VVVQFETKLQPATDARDASHLEIEALGTAGRGAAAISRKMQQERRDFAQSDEVHLR